MKKSAGLTPGHPIVGNDWPSGKQPAGVTNRRSHVMQPLAYSPERFLAIGAGAHALVEALPEGAYPINDVEDLKACATASLGAFSLRSPTGGRLGAEEVASAIASIWTRLGSQIDTLLPISSPDDLAHKAGMALVALVLRHHRAIPLGEFESPDFSESRALAESALRSRKLSR